MPRSKAPLKDMLRPQPEVSWWMTGNRLGKEATMGVNYLPPAIIKALREASDDDFAMFVHGFAQGYTADCAADLIRSIGKLF